MNSTAAPAPVNFPKLIKCRAARGPAPQPSRLLFGAPSRRTFVWRAYCFDLHPRTAMPTTRASSAAPEAGALPIPAESQRSILVQKVAGHPGTGRVRLDRYPVVGGGFDFAGTSFINGSAEGLWLWPFEPRTADRNLRVAPPQQVHSVDVRRITAVSPSADGKFLIATTTDNFWVFNLIESAIVVHLQSLIRLRSEPSISADG